jgi:hypothetical protein
MRLILKRPSSYPMLTPYTLERAWVAVDFEELRIGGALHFFEVWPGRIGEHITCHEQLLWPLNGQVEAEVLRYRNELSFKIIASVPKYYYSLFSPPQKRSPVASPEPDVLEPFLSLARRCQRGCLVKVFVWFPAHWVRSCCGMLAPLSIVISTLRGRCSLEPP